MKPPEQVKRELTLQWMEKADADWRLCHRLLDDPEPYLEGIANATELADQVRGEIRDSLREELDL